VGLPSFEPSDHLPLQKRVKLMIQDYTFMAKTTDDPHVAQLYANTANVIDQLWSMVLDAEKALSK
jgi:hypothetical protein